MSMSMSMSGVVLFVISFGVFCYHIVQYMCIARYIVVCIVVRYRSRFTIQSAIYFTTIHTAIYPAIHVYRTVPLTCNLTHCIADYDIAGDIDLQQRYTISRSISRSFTMIQYIVKSRYTLCQSSANVNSTCDSDIPYRS